MTGSASWRIPNGLSFLWALILGAGILFLPESPRYAYRIGRGEEARTTLARLGGLEPDSREINMLVNEIRVKLEEENSGADTAWYEIFTGPRMLYRTVLGIVLQAGQQLTGANFFFYYGTTIFKATGVNDSYVTQIILGTVNVVCTFAGLYVVQKCGRRNALMAGAAWMFMVRTARHTPFHRTDHVSVLHDLLLRWPLRPEPKRPCLDPCSRKRPHRLLLPVHRGIRYYLGPYRLGRRRRALPIEIPCSLYGARHCIQLAVEFPHLVLHTLHHGRNRLSLRVGLRRLLSGSVCNRLLLRH